MNGVEIKNFKEPMFDVNFGYRSFKDFLSSFLGTWYPVMSMIAGGIVGFTWFGVSAITGHIETYWYSPVQSLTVTLLAIILDWTMGVYNAYRKKTLNTRLAQRVVVMVIANFLLLSLFYNTAKHQISSFGETATALGYLGSKMAALYLTGVHIVSALKNAVMAEVVNADWAKWITNRIDAHKNKMDNLI